MSPFWTSLFDHLKDCGRNAALFLVTLAGLFGVLLLAVILCENDRYKYLVPALPVIGVFAVVRASLAIRRVRACRRERSRYPPLSGDELRVARSKLMKGGT